MAKTDKWSIVDNSNVVDIDDEVKNGVTSFESWSSKLRRINPFSIFHNRMFWSNFETIFQSAEVGISVLTIEFHQTKNLSFLVTLSKNIFTSLNIFNFFNSLVAH